MLYLFSLVSLFRLFLKCYDIIKLDSTQEWRLTCALFPSPKYFFLIDCAYNAHKQCAARLEQDNCQPDRKLIKRGRSSKFHKSDRRCVTKMLPNTYARTWTYCIRHTLYAHPCLAATKIAAAIHLKIHFINIYINILQGGCVGVRLKINHMRNFECPSCLAAVTLISL